MGARGREAAAVVTATLQHYADRGVFRGFRAERVPRGRVRYTFSWLTRVPMSVVFDPTRSVLAFQAVFQGLEPRSPITADLKAMVDGRSDRRPISVWIPAGRVWRAPEERVHYR
jgi:hypothetical protein